LEGDNLALEIEQLIKIISGILVVIAVIIGVYLVFKNQIFDFFNGISAGKPSEVFIALVK
jgi:hypothetical protein